MSDDSHLRGSFDARYLAFLETIAQLRSRLHRYCAHMTGSSLDGEDVVQETLFEAYRKLNQFDDKRALTPWLFRIAHNRCIDFLRRRRVKRDAESSAMRPDYVVPIEPPGKEIGHALEQVVLTLPPRERACLLLKDVFDYSLEEIAEMTGSTVGAVKAALNRGRSKIAALRSTGPIVRGSLSSPQPVSAQHKQILELYVERFNRRDWDGVRELIRADACLLVADRFSGPVSNAPYFTNYQRWNAQWRLAIGEIDNEPVVLVLEQAGDTWSPRGIVRLAIAENAIAGIADYSHCPWVLQGANSISISPAS